MMDPLVLIAEDRAAARAADDPCVDRCVLGTVNSKSQVEQRVLVLRDVEDELAIFYSATSAKHRELTRQRFEASLLVFLPTVGVQYRIAANLEPIPSNIVRDSWQLKPNAAKRMDALYKRYPQSTVIGDVETFETQFLSSVPPVQAPQHSVGYFIHPQTIERLELRTDPAMHLRTRYRLSDGQWESVRLVP